jgi:hypothetical protein
MRPFLCAPPGPRVARIAAALSALLVCMVSMRGVVAQLHPLELRGFFCAGCPSNSQPGVLWDSIHPRYTTIIVAFVG